MKSLLFIVLGLLSSWIFWGLGYTTLPTYPGDTWWALPLGMTYVVLCFTSEVYLIASFFNNKEFIKW